MEPLAKKRLGQIDTSGRDPVIKGTTIEVYRIAALLGGMSVAERLDDNPALDEGRVLAAKDFAERHPKAGRPFPKVTAKKAMREALGDEIDTFAPSRE